jgi:hypothetical protein
MSLRLVLIHLIKPIAYLIDRVAHPAREGSGAYA